MANIRLPAQPLGVHLHSRAHESCSPVRRLGTTAAWQAGAPVGALSEGAYKGERSANLTRPKQRSQAERGDPRLFVGAARTTQRRTQPQGARTALPARGAC